MITKFLLAVFILILAAALQENILIGGVVPNFVFAALTVFVFFVSDFFYYSLLVLFAAALLKFYPGFDFATAIFILVFVGIFWLRQYLPWRAFIGFIFLSALSTAGFYLLSDPGFIYAEYRVFLLELLYNLIAGFILLAMLHDEKKERRV